MAQRVEWIRSVGPDGYAPLLASTVVGVLFGSLNLPLYRWVAAQSPTATSGGELTLWWAALYFAVAYLLPATLVLLASRDRWWGWLGVLTYTLAWLVVVLNTPSAGYALASHLIALGILLVVHVTYALSPGPEMAYDLMGEF